MCRRSLIHYGLALAGLAVCTLLPLVGLSASPVLPLFLLILGASIMLDLSAGILTLVLSIIISAVLLLHRQPPLSLKAVLQVMGWFMGIGGIQLALVWYLRKQVHDATSRAENSLPLVRDPGPSHLYARLVDLSADAVVVTDSQGFIVLFNQRSQELFGYTRDEILGESVDILVPEPLREKHRALVLEYMTAPHLFTLGMVPQQSGQRKDGSTFPAEIALAPIDALIDGHAHMIIKATVRDISERLHQEEELRQEQVKRQVAEQTVKERDRWLAIASHELKSPLTSISGMAALLAHTLRTAPSPLPPTQQARVERALEFLSTHVDRLAQMVDQLLEVSRMDMGRFKLDITDVDLVSLARDQITLAEHRATQHTFVLHAPPTPVVASCDALRMSEVLSNLFDNCLKFSTPGPITVNVFADPTSVHLVVADRGPGIPPDERPQLFERVAPAFNGAYKPGLGLGLWLCRAIMAEHGGTIAADFPEGDGTRFVVCLPRRVAHKDPAHAVSPES